MKRARTSIKTEVKQNTSCIQIDDDDDGEKPSTISKPVAKAKGKKNDMNPLCETVPWATTIPSSPRKNTWMIEELFKESKEIKRMNAEILKVLNKRSFKEDDSEEDDEYYYGEEKEPEYPLKNMRELNWVEEKIKEKPAYGSCLMNMELSMLRGRNENSSKFLKDILKFLMTDELASQFMFAEAEPPLQNFETLELYTVIKRALKKKYKDIDENVVKDEITTWLTNCKLYQKCSVCTSRRTRMKNK